MSAGPLMMHVDPSGKLFALRTDGPGSWMAPGGPAIQGDAVAVEVFGTVRVYGIAGGLLRRWEYDIARSLWTLVGVVELWEDNTPVSSRYGIGLSFGAQSDVPGVIGLYAAIPNAQGIAATAAVPVEFARLDSVVKVGSIPIPPFGNLFRFSFRDERWRRNQNAKGPPVFYARPSLAYLPFGSNDLEGRFFMGYLSALTSTSKPQAWISFTEGNVVSPNPIPVPSIRELVWRTDVETLLEDDARRPDFRSSGIQIAVFGRGLVAAGVSTLNLHYFPAADGVFNASLRDFNDADLIRRNLACSVRNTGCASQ